MCYVPWPTCSQLGFWASKWLRDAQFTFSCSCLFSTSKIKVHLLPTKSVFRQTEENFVREGSTQIFILQCHIIINSVVKQNHVNVITPNLLALNRERTYGNLILVIASSDKLRSSLSLVSRKTCTPVASSAQVCCTNFRTFCCKLLSHSQVSHDTNMKCTLYSFPVSSRA